MLFAPPIDLDYLIFCKTLSLHFYVSLHGTYESFPYIIRFASYFLF